MYVSSLPTDSSISHKLDHGMGGYLYLIGGSVRLNGGELATGDAAKIWDEPEVTLEAREESELIMVEVRLD